MGGKAYSLMAISIRSWLTPPAGAAEVRPNMDIFAELKDGRYVKMHWCAHVTKKKCRWITATIMSDGPPLALHRCRFVDASPSPITALAFPPSPLPPLTPKPPRKHNERDLFGTLVVGHANGNIDLLEWTGDPSEPQASQAWQHRKVGLLTPSRAQY